MRLNVRLLAVPVQGDLEIDVIALADVRRRVVELQNDARGSGKLASDGRADFVRDQVEKVG